MLHHEPGGESRAAAFREAARVIAAWAAGRKIIYITFSTYGENEQANSRYITKMPKRLSVIQLILRGMMDADEAGVTQKDLENYKNELKAFGETQIENDILIFLAGSEAYSRIDKVKGKTACVDDREEAERLRNSLQAESRKTEEEYRARALDFVDSFETWIKSLSELLHENHRVETEEFKEFVQAHPRLMEKKEEWTDQ